MLITDGYSVPKIFCRIGNLSEFLSKSSPLESLHQELQGVEIILRSDAAAEDGQISHAGLFESRRMRTVNLSEFRQELAELHQRQQSSNTSYFVQKFIPCIESGVIFSRNPTNLWDRNGLIETSPHTEAVTSGNDSTQKWNFQDAPSRFHELIRWTREIESKMQTPLDLEWGFDGQQFWIFQVRPVQSDGQPLSFYDRHWTRETADERFPLPMTPLGWDLMENALPANFQKLQQEMGIRTQSSLPSTLYQNFVYVDPEYFRFDRIILDVSWFLKSGAVLRILFFILTLPFQLLRKAPLGFLFLKALYGPSIEKLIQQWPIVREKTLSELALIREEIKRSHVDLKLLERLEKCCFQFFENDILVYALKSAVFATLQQELKATDLQNALASLSHPRKQMLMAFADYQKNPSTEQKQKLIEDYGHIRLDWDLSRPSLDEDNRLFESFSKIKAPEANISAVQFPYPELLQLVVIDEEMQFHSSLFLKVCKELLLKWANENSILPQDLYFYRLNEIRAQMKGSATGSQWALTARQKSFAQAKTAPFELPPLTQNIRSLKGQKYFPVSTGIATGPLFILEDLDHLARVQEGCILYTHHPHPLLMTIYSRLEGLICRTGGPLSHGFISAREFHLPAITTEFEFSSIHQGKRIQISSETGEFQWL